jgi:bisphosphoglycerate-dependent phosphoglycerate mutase
MEPILKMYVTLLTNAICLRIMKIEDNITAEYRAMPKQEKQETESKQKSNKKAQGTRSYKKHANSLETVMERMFNHLTEHVDKELALLPTRCAQVIIYQHVIYSSILGLLRCSVNCSIVL